MIDREIVLKDFKPDLFTFSCNLDSLERPIILSIVSSKMFLNSCAKLKAFWISRYNLNNSAARPI